MIRVKWHISRLTIVGVFLLICLVLLSLAVSSGLVAGEPLNIDLLDARVNGKRINEMTLDDITNLLGRPSAIKSKSSQVFGVDVYYHEAGLVFNVKHLKEDKQQHCSEVYIYLSRVWDQDSSRFFLPFGGILSKGIDGNWKVDRVKAELTGFQMKDYSDDEMIKKFMVLKDVFPGDEKYKHIMTTSRLDIDTDAGRMIIVYEPNTKFVEWIALGAKQPKETSVAQTESITASTTASKATWNEPEEFRGLKFGQDLRKVLRSCPSNWDGKSRCYSKLSQHADLPGDHFVLYNFGPIGGVWIAARATQIQNRLVKISLEFQSKDFEQLRKIFIERYGAPTHEDEKEVTNPLGARFRKRTTWWEGKRLTIFLGERSHRIDYGLANYSTPDEISLSIKEQETQEKKGVKKGVQDLSR